MAGEGELGRREGRRVGVRGSCYCASERVCQCVERGWCECLLSEMRWRSAGRAIRSARTEMDGKHCQVRARGLVYLSDGGEWGD